MTQKLVAEKQRKNEQRILVTYATQYGTTADIARVIGNTLRRDGVSIDVCCVSEVQDLRQYDAVIVGSAIQYDKWMPAVTQFVQSNQAVLSRMPVAYFFSCLTLAKQSEKAQRQALAYADKLVALAPQVRLVGFGRFAGVLDYSKMSFFLRLGAKVVFAVLGVREGDYRDWVSIRVWATSLQLT